MKIEEQTLPDNELIAQLLDKHSEKEGILFLYRNHYKPLSWFVMQNSGTEEDAQDVFQEVVVAFIHLVKNGKFRGESSIKTFLYSLNRNTWFNELKRRGRATEREKKYEEVKEIKDEIIDKTIENREANMQLMNVLEELGEGCKKILLLFYYENYSMKEILSELELENEQVVRNKKYKCMKRLDEMIRQKAGLFQQLKNLLHG